jgi:hypothetical protein
MKCQKRKGNRSDGSKNEGGIRWQRTKTEKWKERTNKCGRRKINGRKKKITRNKQDRKERIKEDNEKKKKDVRYQMRSCYGRACTRKYEAV